MLSWDRDAKLREKYLDEDVLADFRVLFSPTASGTSDAASAGAEGTGDGAAFEEDAAGELLDAAGLGLDVELVTEVFFFFFEDFPPVGTLLLRFTEARDVTEARMGFFLSFFASFVVALGSDSELRENRGNYSILTSEFHSKKTKIITNTKMIMGTIVICKFYLLVTNYKPK